MEREDGGTAERWDGAAQARTLLRTVGTAALATLDRETGEPFASLTTVATDTDGSPLILISGLSAHTGHLDADPRASLLLAALGRGDPLAHPRLTLSGRMEPAGEPRVRRRFLARHPKAELYVDLPDFSFRRMRIRSLHLNGGFGRAGRFDAAAILTDLAGADALAEAEADALDHLNADHADALRFYAARIAGAPADGRWCAVGLDPEGLDLAAGDGGAVRIRFPERVTEPGALRRVLAAMARNAGTAPG